MLSLAFSSRMTCRGLSVRNIRVRLLAAVVLASVAWGAIAGFTHNHGRASIQSIQASGQQASSTSGAAQSAGTNGTRSKYRTAADCLICQLHQNLSTITFSHVSVVAAAEKHSYGSDAAKLFHHGDYSTNRRGRAPPVISLS
ncbi:MAG: DUF2946 family protein [Pyrinomonadaceae bacterium]